MNIHNHSIWPPPGTSDVISPANVAWHATFLQLSVCSTLIGTVFHSPDDASSPVINLMDKG